MSGKPFHKAGAINTSTMASPVKARAAAPCFSADAAGTSPVVALMSAMPPARQVLPSSRKMRAGNTNATATV